MLKKLFAFSVATLTVLSLILSVCAHPGRTDGAGGHYDNSTGEYHYHHGYPAHQHTNGKCPYDFDDKTDHSPNNSNGLSSGHSNKSSDNDFSWGWIVLIFIIVVVIIYIIYKASSGSSSSSLPNPTPSSSSSSSTSSTAKTSSNSPTKPSSSHLPSSNESDILRKKNVSLNKEIETLKLEIRKLKEENQKLQGTDFADKYYRTSRNLSEVKKENDKLKSQISLLSKDKAELEELRKTIKNSTPSSKSASAPSNDLKKISELTSSLEASKTEITSLKQQNSKLKSSFDAISKDRSLMIDRHRKELEQLQSQLDSKPPASPPNYTDNLFQYALRTLESKGDQLFYSSPSVIDFYRQVTDKRFHRSQVEDISFDGKITVKANINSSGTKYETSLTECKCVDFQRTKKPCKHMLFLAYHAGVLFIHKDELEKNMKIYLDELRSTKPKK